MLCLPRPRWGGLLIWASARGLAQNDRLRRIFRNRNGRQAGSWGRPGKGHAGLCREQKRDVLSQRHLRLSTRAFSERDPARTARQTWTEAARIRGRRNEMHG